MTIPVKVDDVICKFENPTLLSDKGGQKIVYTIQHPEFGRCVLKIGHYGSMTTLERIKREVSILSSLKSDYFPTNFDFQVLDQSRFFIIEELINGHTLDKVFRQFSSEQESCKLLNELLSAVSQLWAQKVIHRDLKPENIIIANGGPRILDLGIARVLDETSLTCSLAPFGPCTPNYASPEQLQNRKKSIDHRTDQFSLGIILGQLLLDGTHPFCPSLLGNGSSIPENINANIWAKDILKTKLSEPVFYILQRMLGHEPYQRFRKVDEIRDKLNIIILGES